MNGEAPRAILVGPPMSPPVELTRWLRDRATRPYEFRPRAPALHAFASIRRKVPVELPLLLMPEGAVGGLLNSINALDEELAGGLFERAEQRTFAEELCETLFNPAVRTFYHAMLPERRVLASYATRGVPRTDAIFVRAAYPLWRRLMSKGLGLGSFDPSKAASAIDAAFEAVASALGQSRFLGGSEPDVRDFLFAVLASPVILPPNHPAAIPPVDELPSDFRMRVERWREHRAGKLALRVYEQRPEPANWGNVPPDRLTLRQRAAPGLLRLASRWAAARAPRVLKLGKNVFVSRFADVQEVLARDGDFLIAPINGSRIQECDGPIHPRHGCLRRAPRAAAGGLCCASPCRRRTGRPPRQRRIRTAGIGRRSSLRSN